MAGFTNILKDSFSKATNKIATQLSLVGMNFNKDIIKNSQAIGRKEIEAQKELGTYSDFLYKNSNIDDWYLFNIISKGTLKKSQASKKQSYVTLRNKFYKFAETDLIDDILEKLSDECIVYNERNEFATPAQLISQFRQEIIDRYEYNFKYIYRLLGFNDGFSAWMMFKKWLIEGYICYEIIWDESYKQIIGFKELLPETIEFGGFDNKLNAIFWYQFKNGQGANYSSSTYKERKILDSNIIYIAWNNVEGSSKISYVERLIKAYNTFEIIQQTRLIYAVTQSVFNKTFTIPTGGKSKNRAKQSLVQLISDYKEKVFYDNETGELTINGAKDLPFYKEYWFPKKDGDSVDISTLSREGPGLDNIEPVKYFLQRLYNASKIPASRFDDQSPARYALGDSLDIEREEIQFGNYIRRILAVFQEILIKPVWLQTCADFPELIEDINFKTEIGVNFNKNLLFEEFKHNQILKTRAEFIESMKRIEDDGPDRLPYFTTQFLVEEYLKLSTDKLKKNERYKNDIAKKLKKEESGQDDVTW